MELKELLKQKDQQLKQNNYIEFNDRDIRKMRQDEARHVIEYFSGYTMMKLPPSEVEFFEWLKEADPPVWEDLWSDVEDIYKVSIDFLSQFIGEQNGFPICDLIDQPNYWFTNRHIKPKGIERLEEATEKIQAGQKLQIVDLILYELSIAPIDVWHFCYRHNLPVFRVKQTIDDMVSEGWLVHLTDREDLAKYIDI
ncbi:MAG: hypothetical protein GF313_05360 [Caldithrix sp.]|nr:hypothetical protein [Caldithrix sp.]